MGLAACFSAMEVVPLTLLTLDAWDFVRLQDRRCAECGHAFAVRQTWAIYFLMAVGFWNFVGAGVFGFLINLPIVSYFEVGTLLTSNHGHAAMFGVFGMLALAVVVFCLRALADDARWQRVEGSRSDGLLGAQRRPRTHGPARSLSGRRAPALGLPLERLLARTAARVPDAAAPSTCSSGPASAPTRSSS